jgi:hypothetical protein
VKKDNKIRFVYFGRPLTEDDLQLHAPSVMNNSGPSDRVTVKYSFFPTIQLIRDLRTIGWIPYACEQRTTYGNDGDYRKNFTKHMVVFRNPNVEQVDDLVPEIIVTNSHDGRNSFQFFAGLFHVTKHTSFVIDEASFGDLEDFRVKHQGYEFSEVIRVIDKVVEVIPTIYDKVNLMRKTILTPKQRLSFAFETIRMRWKEMRKEQVSLEDVIKPIRDDEKEGTLWNLFQIVQEKIVNGGIKYDITSQKKDETTGKMIPVKRRQTARALVNIDQKIDVKKSIWNIASQLVGAIRKSNAAKEEELV